MRLKNAFLATIFIILFIGLTISFIHVTKTIPNNFEKEVSDYLNSNIELKSDRINDHIIEIEDDVLFLANSPRIKNMLKSELADSNRAAKLMIDSKTEIISKEIENYILKNSKMTLNDLQNDINFQNIAVQEFGISGYSFIIEKNEETISFHKNKNLIGISAKEIFKPNEDIYLLFNKAVVEGFSSGYYNWTDETDITRKKYGNFKKLNIKTFDNFSFILIATTYIDEFKIIKSLSPSDDKFLKDFVKINNYQNLVLYDSVGYVTYMTEESLDFGLNLKLVEKDKYKDIQEKIERDRSGKIIFTGLFTIKNKVFLEFAIPIYENDELLGIVAIHEGMEGINNILESSTILGSADKNYIIDKKNILITQLNDSKFTPFIQEIRTTSSEKCFKDIFNRYNKNITSKEHSYSKYLDYKGDYVLGEYSPLKIDEWCLISEVISDDILEGPKGVELKREFITQGLTILIIIILIFIFYNKINKKYFLINNRWGKFKNSKIQKFKNSKIFFISAILSLVILILTHAITMKFHDVFRMIFNSPSNSLFQFISLTIFITMFIYSYKIKEDSGKWVFLGGILLIAYNVLNIHLYNYEYLTLTTILRSFGYLSLLAYFWEVKK